MRNIWAVCKREFASYFVTPIGYVLVGTYGAITGVVFIYQFIWYTRVSQSPTVWDYPGVPDFEETMLSPFLVLCGELLIFLGPLITMRLLAEEKNRGTMELLLTYPLRDREIVFGKYFAALGMILVMMGVVAVDLGLVGWFTDVEPAVLVFGLMTVFLMGAAFASAGLLISALARNQITAATATFGVFFVSYVLGVVGKGLSPANPAPDSWGAGLRSAVGFFYGLFRNLVLELPMNAHAKEMAQGIVQAEDIAYYVLFSAFFLFLTFRALESRKWRALG